MFSLQDGMRLATFVAMLWLPDLPSTAALSYLKFCTSCAPPVRKPRVLPPETEPPCKRRGLK